jgi:hypothetical protein
MRKTCTVVTLRHRKPRLRKNKVLTVQHNMWRHDRSLRYAMARERHELSAAPAAPSNCGRAHKLALLQVTAPGRLLPVDMFWRLTAFGNILLKNLLEDGVHSAYGLNVFWI